MKRINSWKKIQKAIENGVVREQSKRAEPEQLLTYVLSDKKLFQHATIESAKSEKEFLQLALDRDIRIYKIWNVTRERLQNDMVLIRGEARKMSKRTNFYKALDRVLEGAGF